MRAYNFAGGGRNLTKFYQVMWLIAGVIKCTILLATQIVFPVGLGALGGLMLGSAPYF